MPIYSAYFILTDTERRIIREIFIEVHTYAYTQCLLHTDRHREKANKRNILEVYTRAYTTVLTSYLHTEKAFCGPGSGVVLDCIDS